MILKVGYTRSLIVAGRDRTDITADHRSKLTTFNTPTAWLVLAIDLQS